MEEDILRLFYKGSEIILIGTSHISAESADLVRKTVLLQSFKSTIK
ncbi:hypothetical protein HRG33_14295 [Enterococcus faecalis]|nr:hypothetical protein [Enterococcus faecalis]